MVKLGLTQKGAPGGAAPAMKGRVRFLKLFVARPIAMLLDARRAALWLCAPRIVEVL
jgi:hypothetical protein